MKKKKKQGRWILEKAILKIASSALRVLGRENQMTEMPASHLSICSANVIVGVSPGTTKTDTATVLTKLRWVVT